MQPLLSDKLLRVVANPFCAPLDRYGRPSGFVQYDPDHVPPGTVRYIGATKTQKLIALRPKFGSQKSKYETRFHFDLTPVPVVHSFYHQERIRGGELFVADEATAKIVGVKKFVDPAVLLDAARGAAIEAWAKQHEEAPQIESWSLPLEQGAQPPLANWPGVAKAQRREELAKGERGGDA